MASGEKLRGDPADGLLGEPFDVVDGQLIGTLRFAISYPAPVEGYAEAEVVEALRAVGLPQLVDLLDDDRMWAQVLSQGEQQRVAFARALLYKPDWLFMDEATSALDTRTERLIQQNLREVSRGLTTIIIAHRLSTVAHADQILVMDGGRIVERGTHVSLQEANGVYGALWRKQLEAPDVS